MRNEDTLHLLDDALEGDAAARGRLLERLRPRLVLWAAARMSPALRAKVEPEDVAQEVLMSVHKSLDGFEMRQPGSFLAWLMRVAENRIRDLVDREFAQKRKTPEPRSAHQTSPSTAAERHELLAQVRTALEDLPENYREVIRLRRLEDLDVPQVAQILDKSENAVRVLYHRALKALGARLRSVSR